jgi:nitroreductase
MKIILFVFLAVYLAAAASAADPDKLAAVSGAYTTAPRSFIAGAVSRAEIDSILNAGIRAPSANNRQPWHFTVVQEQDLARKIIRDLTPGNILIIISAAGDGKTNTAAVLDCALATENIYLAAQALGLGSRIYTGPMNAINSGLKAELELPAGYSAVALVRIGRAQTGPDAVSAASTRKTPDAIVNYK